MLGILHQDAKPRCTRRWGSFRIADVYGYQITACYNGGSNSVCSNAQSYCNSYILSPLGGSYDVYDVRVKNPDPYPPDITSYLSSSALRAKIGAQKTWTTTNSNIYR
jgi:hypothetical protein